MKKLIKLLTIGLFINTLALAQENLPNTETTNLDLSEIYSQNQDVNFIKVFIGKEMVVDTCNSRTLIGTSNNGSHVSFDQETNEATIHVEVATMGHIRSTLRACTNMTTVIHYVSYQVLNTGNKSGIVEVQHPEGFEVRYKLVKESNFISAQ